MRCCCWPGKISSLGRAFAHFALCRACKTGAILGKRVAEHHWFLPGPEESLEDLQRDPLRRTTVWRYAQENNAKLIRAIRAGMELLDKPKRQWDLVENARESEHWFSHVLDDATGGYLDRDYFNGELQRLVTCVLGCCIWPHVAHRRCLSQPATAWSSARRQSAPVLVMLAATSSHEPGRRRYSLLVEQGGNALRDDDGILWVANQLGSCPCRCHVTLYREEESQVRRLGQLNAAAHQQAAHSFARVLSA